MGYQLYSGAHEARSLLSDLAILVVSSYPGGIAPVGTLNDLPNGKGGVVSGGGWGRQSV